VYKPQIVIHTAAIGAVDYCEKHPDQARAVNIDGTRNVAMACSDFRSKLVLLSTNAVFDGKNPPYKETDKVCPLSVYGDTKVLAEDIAQTLVYDTLIIRTARLFGTTWPGGRENWVHTIKKAIVDKRKLRIVTDDITNPTYAGFLAISIWDMIARDARGIFNVAGKASMSMCNFARLLVRDLYRFDPNDWIEPITSAELPDEIIARPEDTSFDFTKLELSGVFCPPAAINAMSFLARDLND
jgi:dTDP-4-dehydrorhamnose reductase